MNESLEEIEKFFFWHYKFIYSYNPLIEIHLNQEIWKFSKLEVLENLLIGIRNIIDSVALISTEI